MDTVVQEERYKREECLDGIRALMALNVILCHFTDVYYPQMQFIEYASRIGGFLSLFATTPFSILVNGNIAVQYFFALSGFLVYRSVMRKSDEDTFALINKAVNRYIRLWPIVTASIAVTFVTMVLKLQYHLEASKFTANSTFLLDFCNFKPSFASFIGDIFVRPYIRSSLYVGPLWTIRYEFWGYILCSIICTIARKSKWRRAIYLLSAVLSATQLSENYLTFFVGVFIADIMYKRETNTTYFSKYYYELLYNKLFIMLCGLGGLYFAACPMRFSSIYKLWEVVPHLTTGVLRAVGVGLLLYFILNCSFIKKVLSCRLLLWFGKISFSTYAFHWPIMLTLESGLFLLLRKYFEYNGAALLSFAITVPIIYFISFLSWRLLEKNNKLSVETICQHLVNNGLSSKK